MAEISTETQVSQQWEAVFLVAKAMFLINVVNDTYIWEPGLAKPSYEQLHCKTKPDLLFLQ